VGLVALFWACYSLSNYIYGTTNNAANAGLTWGMPALFPEANSLSVNGVFYQYTPEKNKADDMLVHVQNKNVGSAGYIFRETDDWSGRAGGTPIRKVVGVDNVPQALWGDGSIEIEGTGTVADASVVYSYKYDDACATPLSAPSCPGYAAAILKTLPTQTTEVYDPLADALVKDVLDEKVVVKDKDEDSKDEEEEEDNDRLEKALSAVDNNVLLANAVAQAQMMDALALAINIDSYYLKDLEGGVYEDTQTLVSEQMPDNKKGARVGLAQQIKHDQMVDMQYGIGE